MSQENVDLVRRLYEAHGGPELDAVTEVVCDPNIEWRASEGFGVLNGRIAVLRAYLGRPARLAAADCLREALSSGSTWHHHVFALASAPRSTLDHPSRTPLPRYALRHFEDFSEAFEDWRVVAEELIDAGDEIVGVTHGHGSGKASGAVVDAHYAIVFTVRANMIVRAREYATRAEALEAVGLFE